MKIVFFGTPDYVIPVLESLHKTFKSKTGKSPIVAVVTQPPKPVGRKQLLEYSPVDTWAHKKKVPKFFDSREIIKNRIQADLGVLAAYGAIIPKEVIEHFPKGILNIHPSLLPMYRGASPVQATLIAGEKRSGVTIIKLDELLDHGPIISQFKEEIRSDDTTGSLTVRLFERSAEVLTILIPAYLAGKITLREQDHDKATFTRMITKEDGFILPKFISSALQGGSLQGKWNIPFLKGYSLVPNAYTLERFIRTMWPWPVAWTYVQLTEKQKNEKTKKRLKILKAHLGKPLTISHQLLIIDTVQLESKNPVPWKQFQEAYTTATFR